MVLGMEMLWVMFGCWVLSKLHLLGVAVALVFAVLCWHQLRLGILT